MSQLTPEMIALVLVPLLLLQLGFVFLVLFDRRISSRQRWIMFAVSLLMLVLIVLYFARGQLEDDSMPSLAVASVAYSYAVQPFILVLFMELLDLERGRRIAWALAAANAAVYLTGFFCPIAFSLVDGRVAFGPLGYACYIASGALLAWLFVLTVRQCRKAWDRSDLFSVFCATAIVVAIVLGSGSFWPENRLLLLTLTMPIACVFLFLCLHVKLERDHENELLAEQRIRIMVSQIQPHFLTRLRPSRRSA